MSWALQVSFIFLPGIFLVQSPPILAESGCKVLEYLDCMPKKRIEGYIIKSSTIMAPGLQICQSRCFNEQKCVSYNLGPIQGGIRTCELNELDHWSLSSALVTKNGYEYCPIENQCSSSPCQGNKRVCLPNFYWNTYTCQAGLWSAWSNYSCTFPTKTRIRSCKNPQTKQAASDCGTGETQQTISYKYTEDISACKAPLGMEDGSITNAQITSTSDFDSGHCSKNNGRLNRPASRAWCRGFFNPVNAYIQVDLGSKKKVTQIATQGRKGTGQWVKTFTLSFSNDNTNWIGYKGHRSCTVHFTGNTDTTSVVINKLPVSITARYVRVYPRTHKTYPSIRLEFYGC